MPLDIEGLLSSRATERLEPTPSDNLELEALDEAQRWHELRERAISKLQTGFRDVTTIGYLLHALAREEGFSGLLEGLELLKAILRNDSDSGLRLLGPDDLERSLRWLSQVRSWLREIPLTTAENRYSYIDYVEAEKTGSEVISTTLSRDQAAARKRELEHRLTRRFPSIEKWSAAVDATDKSYYENVESTLRNIRATYDEIGLSLRTKLGSGWRSPSLDLQEDEREQDPVREGEPRTFNCL